MEVCRRFMQNRCVQKRYERPCKFAHPPDNVQIIDNKVQVCKNFLRGRCDRNECKYYHVLNNMVSQVKQTHFGNHRSPNGFGPYPFGSGFHAQRRNAVPQHPSGFGQLTIGSGRSGVQHHKLQLAQALQQIQGDLQQTQEQMIALQQRFQMLREHEQAILRRMSIGDPMSQINQQFHNNPSMIKNSLGRPMSKNSLPVCRDAMKNRCSRGESACKFAHVPEHLLANAQGAGMVTVCIDFLNNKCEREKCRYFHPPPHLTANLSKPGRYSNGNSLRYKRQISPSPEINDTVIGGSTLPDLQDQGSDNELDHENLQS